VDDGSDCGAGNLQLVFVGLHWRSGLHVAFVSIVKLR
jgi:hypothetical protein